MLLKARARALDKGDGDEAVQLRADLARLGVVVRDENKRQYWRRSGRLSSYCKACQRAAARAARKRRRQDLAAAEGLRAVDRARQRRRRALGGPGPTGGDAA